MTNRQGGGGEKSSSKLSHGGPSQRKASGTHPLMKVLGHGRHECEDKIRAPNQTAP